jgi:hypothetical protein
MNTTEHRLSGPVTLFVGLRFAAITTVVGTVVLTYMLTSFLGRLAEQPATMVELAGAQLRAIIAASLMGAGVSAALVTRHRRRAGDDYWSTSSVKPLKRSTVQFMAIALPVVVAWIFYWIWTAFLLGNAEGWIGSVPVLVSSTCAVLASCAFGMTVACIAPSRLSAPLAVAALYLIVLILIGLGDEFWWGYLLPIGDDALHGTPRWTWVLGQTSWFLGLAALLVSFTSWVSSRPHEAPSGRVVISGAALALFGVVLLFFNGSVASSL